MNQVVHSHDLFGSAEFKKAYDQILNQKHGPWAQPPKDCPSYTVTIEKPSDQEWY